MAAAGRPGAGAPLAAQRGAVPPGGDGQPSFFTQQTPSRGGGGGGDCGWVRARSWASHCFKVCPTPSPAGRRGGLTGFFGMSESFLAPYPPRARIDLKWPLGAEDAGTLWGGFDQKPFDFWPFLCRVAKVQKGQEVGDWFLKID